MFRSVVAESFDLRRRMGNLLQRPTPEHLQPTVPVCAPETSKAQPTYDDSLIPRVLNQVPDDFTGGSMLFTAHHITLPPSSASVREHMDTWPIFDQGDLGSCTANAIASAIEFELKTKGNDNEDDVPSRLFIYYNERAIEGSVDSDSGAQIIDGLRSVRVAGVCSEAAWPYKTENFDAKPPALCYETAIHATSEYRLYPQELLEMKKAIASGYPVVFGIMVYSSFFDKKNQKSGDIPMPDTDKETLHGGHAVLAVGYDDTSERVTFRNSWGPQWGDCGCGTLPYKYFESSLANSMWVIKKTEQFPSEHFG